jgi:hypothetical protein
MMVSIWGDKEVVRVFGAESVFGDRSCRVR